MDRQDRVTEYAKKVCAGEVKGVGLLHILACKRHLNDLARQRTDAFPYYWDPEESEDMLDFCETLTVGEGDEPHSVTLLPCQAFDIGCTWGWKKCSNGAKRFRRRYKSEARQNGKSFENGMMATRKIGFSGYMFGKAFAAATKRRQARIAWEEVSKFIQMDNDLMDFFKIKDYKSVIEATNTHTTFEALSKEGGLDEGFRAIFISLDELHQMRDNKIYKALYNGTKTLKETLVSMITTRGDRLNSFCKEMDDYCVKILKGLATAEDMFVDIYCLDVGDDMWDPDNWIKANPFVCVDPDRFEVLRQDAQTAKDMGGSELRDFMTKSLNMWVENTDLTYIDSSKWAACACDKTLNDFMGCECYVGLDLSQGGDLTTISIEIPEEDEKIYLYSHSFMPRGRMQEHIETDLAPYDLWEQMELITVTGSQADFKNDYGFIIQHLQELVDTYELKLLGIGIDPHNADGVLGQLEQFDCPVVIIKQTAQFLNDATVDMQLLVKSLKVEYNRKNELLSWSFSNAQIVSNSFNEIKVDKRAHDRNTRIDPVDAVIDSHTLYRKDHSDDKPVDPEKALDDYLKTMGW